MSELTLLILRLGFLALMWSFVFAVIYALRSDLFGQRMSARKVDAPLASPFPSASAPAAAAPVPAAAPATPPSLAPTPPVGLRSTAARAPAAPTLPASSPDDFTEVISPAKSAAKSGQTTPARRLVITSGPKEGLEIELPADQLSIGRSSESGLVIRDDYTSTHHARLMLWNDAWMVQDLDSTNGTFLDGARVTVPTPIPLNTPVTIGTTSFELRR